MHILYLDPILFSVSRLRYYRSMLLSGLRLTDQIAVPISNFADSDSDLHVLPLLSVQSLYHRSSLYTYPYSSAASGIVAWVRPRVGISTRLECTAVDAARRMREWCKAEQAMLPWTRLLEQHT